MLVDEPWVARVKSSLPELPKERRNRFVEHYGLPRYDADILTLERDLADYYEKAAVKILHPNPEGYKTVSNWVMTEVLRVVNDEHLALSDFPVSPENLAAMVNLIADGVISGKIAKEVFDEMLKTKEHPKTIVERKGLVQISDTGAIGKIIDEILAKNPTQREQFRNGKEQLLGFFVGETMKATKGKANPKIVNEILKNKLNEK